MSYLSKPPLSAEVTDWVWKQWFQNVYTRVIELDTSGGVVTSVTASSPLASSGGVTPNISIASTIGVSLGGTGVSTITGLIKGNGTSPFSAAIAGTDYVVPSALSSYAQISGTPADNRVGVWTSASAIEGDANFLWNGTNLIVGTTAVSNLNEKLRAEGAAVVVPPTPGMPSATNSDTDPGIALRIKAGSWGFDLGNNSGGAWLQSTLIHASAASPSIIYINPNKGPVVVNNTSSRGWGSTVGVVQVGSYTGLMDLGTASYLVNNLYYNGTNWIYETTGATSGGSIMYFSNGNLIWYTAPTGGTAGNSATVSALAELFLDGSLSLKQASKSGSIFGSAADYTLNVNGTIFSSGAAYIKASNASEFHRDVTGAGTISSPQSAAQYGLHSTSNAQTISDGAGPSMLFFGFDTSSPAAKAFVGRITGVFENNTAGAVSGGMAVNVRANNADTTASTQAARWYANGNYRVEGYTQLGGSGAPAVKMKKLTGTTASSEGSSVTVAHGLTGTKIVGFTAKVDYAGDGRGMPPSHTVFSGYYYDCYHDTTNFIVYNKASASANILSKSFTIIVWYEE